MGLISLVYVSFEAYPMTDDELKSILVKAREVNKSKGVTGMLLYRDGFFIQVLEGEESIVRPLYEKIAKDERHKNVLTVYVNEIENRTFSNWSMGFNKLTESDIKRVEGYNDFLDQPSVEFFTDKPSRATTLLAQFKQRTYF